MMLGSVLKKLITHSTKLYANQMIMKPIYLAGQSKHFQFYSFEEEIHKLKKKQDELKSTDQQQQQENNRNLRVGNYKKQVNQSLKKDIEEINRIYREGNMFNFQIDENYQVLSKSKDFKEKIKDEEYINQMKQFKIIQPLNIIEQILKLNDKSREQNSQLYTNQEKSLVLETFLHNVLLSLLCEEQQLHKRMYKNEIKGPLIDEMFILKQFIYNFLSENNDYIRIVAGNPSLFKYIVKLFEILNIKQDKGIPFIQQYLNATIDDSYHSSLQDISILLLPIQDYIFESGQQFQLQGSNDRPQLLDLSSISLKISKLLKENKQSNSRKQSREDVSTICKTLFCMVRINGGHGKVCLDLTEAILKSNYQSLTEIEMTSIIYSISKLQYNRENEKYFENTLKKEMPNLIFSYDYKLEKMLQSKYFHYARVPYILYCLQNSSKYRPSNRFNSINYICKSLIQIVMKNQEQYKATEITTIIYSLKMINPDYQSDIEAIFRSYFLKLALDQQKKDNVVEAQKHISKKQLDITLIDDQNKDQSKNDQEKNEDVLQKNMNKQYLNSDNTNILQQIKNNIQQLQTQRSQQQQQQPETNIQSNYKQKMERDVLNHGSIKSQNLKKLGKIDMKMQKMRNSNVYFDSLQPVDILCLLIGIRNNDKNQNKEQLNSILVINQQLFQLFLSKQNNISNHLKIKILYEVAYNHQLLDSYLFEKNFKDWIISTTDTLHQFNNHDFIALGYIMKKFVKLFAYHIDFWIKYCEESNKRNYNNRIENQRIRQLLYNMKSFFYKCHNSSTAHQKKEQDRIQRMKIVYDLLKESLSKLGEVENNKLDDQQSDEVDTLEPNQQN